MACTYCGIPLLLDTPDHDSFVSGLHDFSLNRPSQNDGYSSTDTEYFRLQYQNPKEALPEIGVLSWPRGASKCATFYGLVDGARLDLIRTAVDGNNGVGDLVLSNPNNILQTITAKNMRLLPPLPVHKIGTSAAAIEQQLYLITLVDQRWSWREKTFAIYDKPVSWNVLLADLAAGLGISLTVSTIPADYLTPSIRWIQQYKQIPALLDAALATIGQKLIVKLNGVVSTTDWETAKTDAETQLAATKVIIGGELVESDLTRVVPEKVLVTFGKLIGEVLYDDPYTKTETLVSLSVPGYGTDIGVAGNTWILNADYIYDGTTTNIANCALVASQSAYDWYGWQLCDVDFTTPGILNWVPTGAEDLIEWRYQYNGRLLTRVVRPPFQQLERGGFNPAVPYRNPLVRIIAATTSTGEYSNRYTVRQVYITDTFDEDDVVIDSGFIEWTDVVERNNTLLTVSTSPVPSQGVYSLHTAPDGHYYIEAIGSTGSGSGSGGEVSWFARLTTSNGKWWKWVQVAPNASGNYQDVGVESTAFNAIPCTIDGTSLANPVANLRVRMWTSTTAFSGGTQYEFLPIGMTDSTHPGLVSLADQVMGNGSKTFQKNVEVNSTDYAQGIDGTPASGTYYPFIVNKGNYGSDTNHKAFVVRDVFTTPSTIAHQVTVWPAELDASNQFGTNYSSSSGYFAVGGGVYALGVGSLNPVLGSNSGIVVNYYAAQYGSFGGGSGGASWLVDPHPLVAVSSPPPPPGTAFSRSEIELTAVNNGSADCLQTLWKDTTNLKNYYGFSYWHGGVASSNMRLLVTTGYAIGGGGGDNPSTITDGLSGSLLWGATATGGIITNLGSSTVPLANGGTGRSLVAPAADSIYFYDVSAGHTDWLSIGSNLAITGTTLDCTVPPIPSPLSDGQLMVVDTGTWQQYTPTTGFFYFNGTSWSNINGASGTFTTADSKTVTVTNGLITSIV